MVPLPLADASSPTSILSPSTALPHLGLRNISFSLSCALISLLLLGHFPERQTLKSSHPENKPSFDSPFLPLLIIVFFACVCFFHLPSPKASPVNTLILHHNTWSVSIISTLLVVICNLAPPLLLVRLPCLNTLAAFPTPVRGPFLHPWSSPGPHPPPPCSLFLLALLSELS